MTLDLLPQSPATTSRAYTIRDVHDYVEHGDVPDLFLDIISHDVMRAPIQVAQTGQIYDRQSWMQWRDTCLAKGAALGGVVDPNTNIPLGYRVKLKRVPELEKALQAFRRAVNAELLSRGEPTLEDPSPARDGLIYGCWLGCFAVCFGAE